MPSGICRQNAFFEDDFPVAEEEARTFREYHERMVMMNEQLQDKSPDKNQDEETQPNYFAREVLFWFCLIYQISINFWNWNYYHLKCFMSKFNRRKIALKYNDIVYKCKTTCHYFLVLFMEMIQDLWEDFKFNLEFRTQIFRVIWIPFLLDVIVEDWLSRGRDFLIDRMAYFN
ncbi:11275_t:CDS:2 [Funneliformis geosporum]|nr:11275_t:CDS:2 [Funneliformis geosporum]